MWDRQFPTAPSVCPKFPRPMASEAVLDHDVITNDVIFPNTHTQLIESAQKMNSEILESVKELVTVSLPSISLSLSLSLRVYYQLNKTTTSHSSSPFT